MFQPRFGTALVALAWLASACAGGGLKSGASAAASGSPYPEPESVWSGSKGGPEDEDRSRERPFVGMKGMVVADDRIAAEWGSEILRRGGNAVDAAVATAFAMSVTRPLHSSIGGGGFMVYCPAPKSGVAQECTAIDYRERASMAATRDLFIVDGKPRPDLSQAGALASGVPGVVAGLMAALDQYGSFPDPSCSNVPSRSRSRGLRSRRGPRRQPWVAGAPSTTKRSAFSVAMGAVARA